MKKEAVKGKLMLTTNERRNEYYKEEKDLFTRHCEHKNIVDDKIIHPEIGIEYFRRCADCGEDEMNFN